MTLLRLLMALAVVVILQTLAVSVWHDFAVWVDPFLILTLYFGLGRTPNQSVGAGTLAGLTHDALSGGLFGLHGAANTLVAWLSALFQQRVVTQQPLTVALLFAIGTAVQTVTLALLQVLMVNDGSAPDGRVFVGRTVTSAILGCLLYVGDHRLRKAEHRWREQRRRRLRIDRSQERPS